MALTQVSTDGIKNSTIVTADLADDAVTGAKIASQTITGANILDLAISAAELNNDAVTTQKLADGAVNNARIADDTITNLKINSSAAIAGTKISPNFGSQNIITTGDLTIDTNTLHVDSSNNRVGIGTTSVDRKFHVEGTDNVMGKFQNDQSLCLIEFQDTDTTAGNRPSFGSDANNAVIYAGGSEKFRVDNFGRVGIGNITPGSYNSFANTLVVATSTNTGLTLSGNDASTNFSGIHFSAGTTVRGYIDQQLNSTGRMQLMNMATGHMAFGTSNQVRMTIDSSGRLLTGGATTSQGSTNADDLQIGANNQGNQTGITLGSASASSIRFADAANDSAGHITYNHSTNELTLKANDFVRVTADTFFAPNIKIGSSNDHDSAKIVLQGSNNNSGTNSVFIKNSDETPLFQVRNDGAFFTGIDGNSPYNLTTSGAVNCHISSDGTLRRKTSSVRYKKDIADATFGLADVLKLKPKTFKNNNTGEFADDKTYAGFTAEDIHDLGLTEFVQYNEANQPDALAYGEMVALMAKAIQEVATKIEELETEVAALKAS